VLAAQAQLLRHAGDAERLAGEAAAEDVVRGDVGDGDAVDVAVRALVEIGLVGLLAEFVVVGGEDAAPAGALEGEAVSRSRRFSYAASGMSVGITKRPAADLREKAGVLTGLTPPRRYISMSAGLSMSRRNSARYVAPTAPSTTR
jgi:hypothetical protein